MEDIKQIQGWRKIETAPKDGTKILLSCGNYVVIASWRKIDEIHLSSYSFPNKIKNKKLWLDRSGDAYNFGANKPTHWQYLPTLPKED